MKRSDFISSKKDDIVEKKSAEKNSIEKPYLRWPSQLSSDTAVLMMEEAKRIAEEKRKKQMEEDLKGLFSIIELCAKKGEDCYMPTSFPKEAKIADAIVENKKYLQSLGYNIFGNKFMRFFGISPIISWNKKEKK